MKISIIIPAYNAEKYINGCLHSITSQGCPELEIIVVNDGSSDNTSSTAAAHAGVKVIDKVNGGAASARNAGLRVATGDYVWFVDADDHINDGSLSVVLGIINTFPCDIITFDALKITEDGQSILTSKSYGLLSVDTLVSSVLSREYHFTLVWSCLYKREFLLENELFFNENLIVAEDAEFAQRAAFKATSCYASKEVLYSYIVRRGSSSQSLKGMAEKYLASAKCIKQIMDSHHYNTEDIKALAYDNYYNLVKLFTVWALMKDIFISELSAGEKKQAANALMNEELVSEAFKKCVQQPDSLAKRAAFMLAGKKSWTAFMLMSKRK